MPTITSVAADESEPFDRCADCRNTMPDRLPTSPPVRRCETCWWAHNRRLFAAGNLDAVHPLALSYLQRRDGPGTVTAPR